MLAAVQDLALLPWAYARVHPFAALALVVAAAVYYAFCVRRPACAKHLPQLLYGYTDVRACGGAETFQTVACEQYGAFRTASVFRVRGPLATRLPPNALVRACWALQGRFPALRWGVHRKADGALWFHEYADARRRVHLQYVPRGRDDTAWQRTLEELNNGTIEAVSHEHLLWRLYVALHDTTTAADRAATHELFLVASHSIVDGTSRVLFAQWFVKALNAIADRPDDLHFVPCFDPVPVHPSQETMCRTHPLWSKAVTTLQRWTPDKLRLLCGWVFETTPKHRPPHNGVTNGFGTYAPPLQRRDRTIYQRLEADVLAPLLAASKARRLRLHAVLVGCMLHAWQRTFKMRAGAHVEHTSPVRVRDYAPDPAAVRDVIGHTAAFYHHTVTLHEPAPEGSGDAEATEAAWRYARDVHEYMYVDAATRLPGSAFHGMADNDGMALFGNPLIRDIVWHEPAGMRFANLMVSNLGDCTTLTPPDDDATTRAFALVDWYCAQGQRLVGQDLFAAVASYRGALLLTWTYTDPLVAPANADRFCALVLDTIRACAASAPPPPPTSEGAAAPDTKKRE